MHLRRHLRGRYELAAALGVLIAGAIAPATSAAVERPDLIVTAISDPPASFAPGARFAVTDQTKNVGKASAKGSITRYYLSSDARIGPGDVLLGGRRVQGLKPKRSSRGRMSVLIPAALASGSYRVIACADDWRKVRETRERNNCRASAKVGSACPRGPFGAGLWPPACWRPYHPQGSPFNRPLPPSPRRADNSAAVVAYLRGPMSVEDKPANLVAPIDGRSGEPTYYARSSDPVFRINCLGSEFHFSPPDPRFKPCPIQGHEIRIPAGAQPEGGTDRHMNVVAQGHSPPGDWEYDLWRVQAASLPASGGQLNVAYGGRTDLGGSGLAEGGTCHTPPFDPCTGPPGDGTAAGWGDMAGRLRAEELEAAIQEETDSDPERGVVHHPLFITIPCVGTATSPHGKHFVYPARKKATKCSGTGLDDAKAPPTGSLFRLNLPLKAGEDVDQHITNMPIPPWKKVLLRTMAKYGMYAGDTGSRCYFAIETEAGNQYSSLGFEDRWRKLATDQGWELGTDHDLVGRLYTPNKDNEGPFNWEKQVWEHLELLDPCVAARTC